MYVLVLIGLSKDFDRISESQSAINWEQELESDGSNQLIKELEAGTSSGYWLCEE